MIKALAEGEVPDETNSHVFSRDGLALSAWLLPGGVYRVSSKLHAVAQVVLSAASGLDSLEADLMAQYRYRLRRAP